MNHNFESHHHYIDNLKLNLTPFIDTLIVSFIQTYNKNKLNEGSLNWLKGFIQSQIQLRRILIKQEIKKTPLSGQNFIKNQRESTELVSNELIKDDQKSNIKEINSDKVIELKVNKVKKDFFGRIITDESSLASTCVITTHNNSSKLIPNSTMIRGSLLRFKYHEGFANAVKKPLLMKEFMALFK